MNCDFLEAEYFYHLSGQGESSDTVSNPQSWLPMSMPNPSPEADPKETVNGSTEQTSNANVQSPYLLDHVSTSPPRLISEVRNFDPVELPTDEAVELPSFELTEIREQDDATTVDGDTGHYVLPSRSNRGVPPKLYIPEKMGRKSRYSMANIMMGSLTEMARSFEVALYEEEEIHKQWKKL